jgi:CCR4-NOT transcription complex subunit 3
VLVGESNTSAWYQHDKFNLVFFFFLLLYELQLLREQQARAAQAAEQLRQQQQQAQQLAQRQQQEVQQQLQRQQQQQQEALRQQKASAAAVAQQEALQRQQQQQQQQQQQEQALRQQQQEAAAKQQAQLQQQVAEKLQQQQQQQPRSQAVGLDILASGLGGLTLGNTDRGETTNLATSSSQNTGVPPLATSASASTAVTGTSLGTSGSYDAASSYLTALNESLATLPNATESERTRPYTPSNPYPTPACYPSLPSTMFDNPAVFEKLGTDCLFFIFYYAQGTYQQYLAARELKKQSWRFHKKFMTWFQRHEEPKVTTDEYEQGTYVYFDYESGWCTRIKSDFRFEYIYLEDSLQ